LAVGQGVVLDWWMPVRSGVRPCKVGGGRMGVGMGGVGAVEMARIAAVSYKGQAKGRGRRAGGKKETKG